MGRSQNPHGPITAKPARPVNLLTRAPAASGSDTLCDEWPAASILSTPLRRAGRDTGIARRGRGDAEWSRAGGSEGHLLAPPEDSGSLALSARIKTADVKAIAVSHTHPDHTGNVELFPTAMLYVQKAEYEWPGPNKEPRFKPGHPVTELEGDRDVFGDGSVTIVSTPGHTPGHQSLLVKLPKTGAVVLSGDAAHFRDNWDNRRVPSINFNKEQTLASMQKLSEIMTREHAQLWINHDKAQRDSLKMSPEFYD